MNIKQGNIKGLSREDRAIAKLARIAQSNTIFGGASALVIAKRLGRMGSSVPALEIVSDVYSRSTGRNSEHYGCWECPECGQSYVGIDAARQCCAFHDQD